MTDDHASLADSWNLTRSHLAAARRHLTARGDVDVATAEEFLDHNELGLAFDCLVDAAHDLELPLTFWQDLDRAAREMRLYSAALNTPHLTAADVCLRHLAAASEGE